MSRRDLSQLRRALPTYRFYEDDRYGFCVLAPHNSLESVPRELRLGADVVLGLIRDTVVVLRDQRCRAGGTQTLRLFQVIAGLVPDGIYDSRTVEQIRVLLEAHIRECPTVSSSWARLKNGPDFDF